VAIDFEHQPVLLSESLDDLRPAPGHTIVDGTVGGGGHAEAILERTAPDGLLIGFDRDPEARAAAAERLARFGDRVRLLPERFDSMDTALPRLGVPAVDGVLLDLGVSSHQLDRSQRGFRFRDPEAPLDMRMDPTTGFSAAELLRDADEDELAGWLRDYGELRGARRLARAIVATRRERPVARAGDLIAVIREAGVGGGRRHDPATLVFQALRIAVNDELRALELGLEAAVRVLRPGGRLVVIAYHSLEDRIVKNHLRDAARGCVCPKELPQCVCGRRPTLRLVHRRPVRPSDAEVSANPRARSARLRAAERIEEAA